MYTVLPAVSNDIISEHQLDRTYYGTENHIKWVLYIKERVFINFIIYEKHTSFRKETTLNITTRVLTN